MRVSSWFRGHRAPTPSRDFLRTRLVAAVIATLAILAGAPAASATPPDRNGRILFQAETDHGIEIFTIRPNGRGLRELTDAPAGSDAAAGDWSPHGRSIVFELGSETAVSVQVMDADGGHVRDLTSGWHPGEESYAFNPSFTPDGRIVFGRYLPATDDLGIWMMNADGSGQHELGDLPFDDPNVSPDGRKLLVYGSAGTEQLQALYTADIDGSNLRRITSFELDVAGKSDWSPDGRRILTSDNANVPERSANLVTMRADGSDLRHVTHYTDPAIRAYAGSYSPDGRWIAFRLEKHGLYALCVIRPDGTGFHRITKFSTFRPRHIDWGPAAHPKP